MRRCILLLATLLALPAAAQEPPTFTRADTLRGTHGPERSWWDVTFYDLHVRVSPADAKAPASATETLSSPGCRPALSVKGMLARSGALSVELTSASPRPRASARGLAAESESSMASVSLRFIGVPCVVAADASNRATDWSYILSGIDIYVTHSAQGRAIPGHQRIPYFATYDMDQGRRESSPPTKGGAPP